MANLSRRETRQDERDEREGAEVNSYLAQCSAAREAQFVSNLIALPLPHPCLTATMGKVRVNFIFLSRLSCLSLVSTTTEVGRLLLDLL